MTREAGLTPAGGANGVSARAERKVCERSLCMDEFYLFSITVGFRSSEAGEVERLMDALKSGKGKGVEEVLAYLNGGELVEVEIDDSTNSISVNDPDADASAFFPLIRAYPRISFGFDFKFSAVRSGWYGRGRYFCLYESGKKVFDASSYVEESEFLNAWLNENEVEGDFYEMELEEAKEAAAKALLRQRGEEETPEAVERVIESFYSAEDYFDNIEYLCDALCYAFEENAGLFENAALVNGENFNFWCYALLEDQDEVFIGPMYQDGYEFAQFAREEEDADEDGVVRRLLADTTRYNMDMPDEIEEEEEADGVIVSDIDVKTPEDAGE
jgi:hypothetical protein